MKINVAQQLKCHIGESRSYIVDETSSNGFSITGEATLVLTNRSILVTGRFQTVITNTCSRCLEEVEQVLVFDLEEEYFPVPDILPGDRRHEDEEAEGFRIGEDNVLDLDEAFRQNILLSSPRKPVCRPDCAGLCQKCGCNLNYSLCDCVSVQADARWSPLRKLSLGNG